jgi:bisphosphoglycerate-dependent phosphoglycerate mutase
MEYQKSILINNIISIATETITGQEFERMNIVWIKTNDGDYEILFDAYGEPVQQITNTVNRLATFFEKHFKPAVLNDQKCLIHTNN